MAPSAGSTSALATRGKSRSRPSVTVRRTAVSTRTVSRDSPPAERKFSDARALAASPGGSNGASSRSTESTTTRIHESGKCASRPTRRARESGSVRVAESSLSRRTEPTFAGWSLANVASRTSQTSPPSLTPLGSPTRARTPRARGASPAPGTIPRPAGDSTRRRPTRARATAAMPETLRA